MLLSFEILGVDLYHILGWFIIYSFLGWIWESSYVSVKNKKWVNRGFIAGPFVTIYGVGAVMVYVILRPLTGRVIELYFGGVVVATLLEYVTGVLMETIFHANWWDYSNKKFNIQGKICLGSSVAWGFFTLALFYILQPFVASILDEIPRQTGVILIDVWLVCYAVDFAFSAAAAFDLVHKIQNMDEVWEEFHEHLKDSRIYELAEDMRERAEMRWPGPSPERFKESMEKRRRAFQEALLSLEESDQRFKERRELILAKYDAYLEHFQSIHKTLRPNGRRYLNAYPELIRRTRKIREKHRRKRK